MFVNPVKIFPPHIGKSLEKREDRIKKPIPNQALKALKGGQNVA